MDCIWCREVIEDRWRCEDCQNAIICAKCKNEHEEKQPNHHIVMMEIDNEIETEKISLYTCQLHLTKDLSLYCGNCEMALCQECAETYEHSSHLVILLQNAVYNYQSAIENTIKGLKDKINQLETERNTIDELKQSLNDKTDESAKLINECFSHLVNLLEVRKNQLLDQLCCETETTRKELLRRQDTINSQIRKMVQSCPTPFELKKSLPELQTINKQLKQLLDHSTIDNSQESHKLTKDNWPSEFVPTCLANVEVLVIRLGTIASTNQLQAEVTAEGEGLRYCCVKKAALIIIFTKSDQEEPVFVDKNVFEIRMIDKFGQSVGDVDIRTDSIEGKLELTYELTEPGIYYLSIKLYEHAIRGSPFQIYCLSEQQYSVEQCVLHSRHQYDGTHQDDLIQRIGSQGKLKHQFTNPQGVFCAGNSNKYFIADSQHQSVKVFDMSGQFITQLGFGRCNKDVGALRRPTGVCVRNDGQVFVADYDNKWIGIYDGNFRFIRKLGGGRLLGPKGIAIDQENKLIVIDNKASSVFIFSQEGKFIRKFGSRGNKPHQLAGPHYVAINDDNFLYITDFHNHCVKVYDVSGEYLFNFGQNGEGNGEFNGPTGIAIDQQGNVLVSDWGNNRIQIFNHQGIYLCQIDCQTDPIFGPQGLAITPDGNIAVSDTGNHCIKIYRYMV